MANRVPLADPDDHPDRDVVIYDGQCNFCSTGVRQLQRLDLGGKRLSYISLHDDRMADRHPELSHDDLMDQMYVIDRSGQAHGGSEAVKYLSRRLPSLWLAMPLLHLPGTASLWRWAYQQVAKRRYKIAGKSDCHDACAVHLD